MDEPYRSNQLPFTPMLKKQDIGTKRENQDKLDLHLK